jgi:pimeloyl-ACP methyl ester carboxylesterase
VVNPGKRSFDAYANGVQTGAAIPFVTDAAPGDITAITFSMPQRSKGAMLVDDLLIRLGEHPPASARLLADPLPPDVPFPGGKSTFRGYDRYRFTVGRGVVTVFPPKTAPLPGKPWFWRGSFWGDSGMRVTEYTVTADLRLLDKGFHVVCAGPGVLLGHPDGNSRMDDIYEALTTQYGFAKKPALSGISRETLGVYRWGSANPDKVGCIYIDNGVCNLKSWPAGRLVPGNASKAVGDATQWHLFLKTYGFKSDAEGLAYAGNPIDILEPLARARVPLLHVCGDKDTATPYEENSAIVKSRYEEMGGPIEIILKKGIGHESCGLEDPTAILDFVQRHAAPNVGE